MFGPQRSVPAEYRSNFHHLYGDIAWFGVLAASAGAFVTVYAARLGASAFQIGLFTAGPAMVNLVVTLPAGRWLEHQPMDLAVFFTSILTRVFYLLWIPLPWFLGPQPQVWALIGLTLLLSVPGTPLAVGFNALFAEAVPPEWRGHVVGVRNALLSVTYIAVSLICGQILVRVPFPMGYQIVFAIGCLGAAMSSYHLWYVRPCPNGKPRQRIGQALGDLAWPGRIQPVVEALRAGRGLRFLLRRQGKPLLDVEALKGPYGRFMAVLFTLNFTLYLAIPLFPVHWVDNLHLTDQEIGVGNALFYVTTFIGSMLLARLVGRLGHHRVTAAGAFMVCLYPVLMSLARGLGLFLVGSVVGGFASALLNGALINYLLEKIPEDRRPSYLAWYNLWANAALLAGSLIGPAIAGLITLRMALMVFAGCRLGAALLILLWEKESTWKATPSSSPTD